MVAIGKQLKYLREKKKMTQKEVAKFLHLTPQTISKWELDKSYPDLEQLVTLSELYNIRIDKLLGQAKPSFLDYLANPDGIRHYSGYLMMKEGEDHGET